MEKYADLVVIPELTSKQLVKRARQKFQPAVFRAAPGQWELSREEQGRIYQVRRWTPEVRIDPSSVETFYRCEGLVATQAAFVSWVTERAPYGTYVAMLAGSHNDDFPDLIGKQVMLFERDGSSRKLDLNTQRPALPVGTTIVGFREMESPRDPGRHRRKQLN
jgi:hypothetical protein